jgi:5'-3' exonuclease
VAVRGAATLAASLRDHRDEAFLFRELATLVTDVPQVSEELDDLRWRGAHRDELTALADRLNAPDLIARVPRWAD